MQAWESTIGHLQARLAATAGLPSLLAAGFDTFELIRVAAEICQDQPGPAFATWAMTSAKAAAGRNALASAPSLPSGGDRTEAAALTSGDEAAAAAMGGLAARLAACMAAAAHRASAGDRAACEHAVGRTAHIANLLAGAG